MVESRNVYKIETMFEDDAFLGSSVPFVVEFRIRTRGVCKSDLRFGGVALQERNYKFSSKYSRKITSSCENSYFLFFSFQFVSVCVFILVESGELFISKIMMNMMK